MGCGEDINYHQMLRSTCNYTRNQAVTRLTCNWKINSNGLGISTPPSPGALRARRRILRELVAMQETKSYERPTKGCPSFSSVAAMIRLKQIHVDGLPRPLSKSLRLLQKRAGYPLHLSKVFISLTEDQNDAGSSKAKYKRHMVDVNRCGVQT